MRIVRGGLLRELFAFRRLTGVFSVLWVVARKRSREAPVHSTHIQLEFSNRLLTNHGVSPVQIKNWLPFVLGPALAIDSVPTDKEKCK